MNLEQFKLLSKEEVLEYGKTIPLGYTYNSNNNELTYKDSNDYWRESTYNSNGNKLTYKDSNDYWWESTYDSNNNQLTYKDSNDYWWESTYDSNNNQLTHKNSNDYLSERTYDSNDNELTHKDSNGVNRIALIKGEEYTLWYDIDSKQYVAGCRELSYKKCLAYYKTDKDEYVDAEIFMKTIKEHHKTVAIVL